MPRYDIEKQIGGTKMFEQERERVISELDALEKRNPNIGEELFDFITRDDPYYELDIMDSAPDKLDLIKCWMRNSHTFRHKDDERQRLLDEISSFIDKVRETNESRRPRRGRLLREARRKDGRNNNWAIRSLPVARDVAGNIDKPADVRYVGELSSPDRASFYGKAKLYFDDEGNEYLKSYDTFVAKKTPEGETFLLIDPVDDDWAFTATTARHIKAFASNEENFSKDRWTKTNGSWERREELVPRIDRRKERGYHLR